LQKEDDSEVAEKNSFSSFATLNDKDADEGEMGTAKRKKKRKRRCFDDKGNTVFLRPRVTLWCQVHCSDDNNEHGLPIYSKLFQKFQRRFRMPYDEFRRLLARVSAQENFKGQCCQRRFSIITDRPPSSWVTSVHWLWLNIRCLRGMCCNE